MWVRRWILFVKPGLMAQAVAHLKTAPQEEGVTYRLLQPISGEEAGYTLISEASFDDPDAQYASLSNPQAPGDWMQRWIELSQNRGNQELYQVRHTIEAEGAPGLWVDRRVRWVKDRKRSEALRHWHQYPSVPVPGASFRVLTPRTGKKAGNVLVVESTFDSLTEFAAGLGETLATSEGRAWLAGLRALELHEPTMELLRVIP